MHCTKTVAVFVLQSYNNRVKARKSLRRMMSENVFGSTERNINDNFVPMIPAVYSAL